MDVDLSEQQLIAQIKAIDWFQFEKLVGLLFEEAGYSVEHVGGAKADGGVDLIVSKPPNDRGVVQCKHWRNWKYRSKTFANWLAPCLPLALTKVFVLHCAAIPKTLGAWLSNKKN